MTTGRINQVTTLRGAAHTGEKPLQHRARNPRRVRSSPLGRCHGRRVHNRHPRPQHIRRGSYRTGRDPLTNIRLPPLDSSAWRSAAEPGGSARVRTPPDWRICHPRGGHQAPDTLAKQRLPGPAYPQGHETKHWQVASNRQAHSTPGRESSPAFYRAARAGCTPT